VIELASFEEFNETHHSFLNQLMETVGIVLNTIAATMRTEGLLAQSQLLTQELQARQTELTTKQEELHATNEELQEKAQLLENEKRQVEAKNFEIDMARRAVEEKAEQLALTSKYKSEFLANMSHELRTPLNSLLILSKLLADNQQGNFNEKQTEFARTIHGAGTDLLNLINDILDLSKIESGTVSIELGDMPLAGLKQHMERTFRQLASERVSFKVDFDESCRDHPHRRKAAPAGRPQPAVQRVQVHRPGRRDAVGPAATEGWSPTIRCCAKSTRRSRSRSATPASASRRTSRS
jgi:signal transduction histidine kinase